MFKIGEFSRLAQVSTRMLRHYDQIGLLKPGSTDEWTGYRYYAIEQLPRLHRIIALKELGFSLEQVSDLLRDDDLPPEQLRGMLKMRQAALQRELDAGQRQLAQIEARLQQIERDGHPPQYEVVIKRLDALPIASVRQVVPHVSEMDTYCRLMFGQLYDALAIAGVKPAEPELTIYHAAEYHEEDLDVETAVAVAPDAVAKSLRPQTLQLRQLPEVDLAAALLYEGPFREVQGAVLDLLRWVGMNGHVPAGPLRELHLSGPAHPDGQLDESPFLELQLPIAPAAA